MGQLFRPTQAGYGELRDRGSRFLAYAYPVRDQATWEGHLQDLRQQYYDARHHCYAYRLGPDGETAFANDDGEPSHSAGDPILGAIRSRELTDVLVVVVRYFGGIKLGVRGLIEAYRTAALAALEEVHPEVITLKALFQLSFRYDQTSDIQRILHPYPIEVVDAHYDASCRITYAIPADQYEELAARFQAADIHPQYQREHY